MEDITKQIEEQYAAWSGMMNARSAAKKQADRWARDGQSKAVNVPEKIYTDHDRAWDYKIVDNMWWATKKGQNKWLSLKNLPAAIKKLNDKYKTTVPMNENETINESLEKMKNLMNFQPGMTATQNKEVIKEDLEDPIGSDVNDIPEPSDTDVAEEVKEGDVTEKFDFIKDVVEKNKKKDKDDDEDDDKKEDVEECDDVKEEEPKEGATNMAVGFVAESAPSNKEMKRQNKQDRLDKKLGRV